MWFEADCHCCSLICSHIIKCFLHWWKIWGTLVQQSPRQKEITRLCLLLSSRKCLFVRICLISNNHHSFHIWAQCHKCYSIMLGYWFLLGFINVQHQVRNWTFFNMVGNGVFYCLPIWIKILAHNCFVLNWIKPYLDTKVVLLLLSIHAGMLNTFAFYLTDLHAEKMCVKMW